MTPRLALDNYYVATTSLVAGVSILLYCVSLYQQAKKSKLLDYFLLTMSMLFLWFISKLLKTASPDVHIRWFFIVTQYLGICLLNYFFVQFSWLFAYNQPMKKKRKILFLTPTLISFLIIATNPLHMYFYSKYDLFRDSFGPLFYPHQLLSYLYLGYGVYLCTKEYRNSFYLKHLQSRIFAIAIFIPIIINIMYVTKVLKKTFGLRLPMDITPLAAMVSLGLFSVAIKRYRFLDITPYAYEKALQYADKGIGVFDADGHLRDANEKFHHFLANTNHSAKTTHSEAQIIALLEDQNLKHQHFVLKNNKGIITGHVHEWIDQTSIRDSIAFLKSNNAAIEAINEQLRQQGEKLKEMERLQTANRVSRDLHDVLGNTLVLTKSTLEMIAHPEKQNLRQNAPLLEKARGLMETGISELSKVVYSSKQSINDTPGDLLIQLEKLSAQFQGTSVHLNINFTQPLHISLQDNSHEIYAIVRESVTNAIRHGNAEDIYVLYTQNQLFSEFHIIDNGTGCNEIHMGMGLKGMHERASILGGNINWYSLSEGGFKVTLTIPHSKE